MELDAIWHEPTRDLAVSELRPRDSRGYSRLRANAGGGTRDNRSPSRPRRRSQFLTLESPDLPEEQRRADDCRSQWLLCEMHPADASSTGGRRAVRQIVPAS